MEPLQYLTAVRKRWIVIAALTILGALGGYAYAASQPLLYRATSSVFVASQRGETTSELVQGSTFTQNLVQSYSELATLPVVLNPVIEELDLDRTAQPLARAVTANIKLNTVIIEITVSDTSPEDAAAIANGITASLAATAEQLAPTDALDLPAISMRSVAEAQIPLYPYSPNKPFLAITGLGIGLLLGLAYALARELLDTRLGSEESVKGLKILENVPFLGSITARRGRNRPPVVMLADPHGIAAEEYRRLCTNLEFASIDRRIRALAVTSAVPGDGKTTTSLNLAAAMAERAYRVLLVDADLRRPSAAKYLNIEGAVGITDVLLGGVSAEDAIQRVGDVDVLPAGTTPPNVTQLVTSAAMARLFAELIARYDFVLVDSPPLLPVTDALTFANLTDGAIVVTKQKATRRQQLTQAIEALNVVNARVVGVVLNGVARTSTSAYGYAPAKARRAEALVLAMTEEPPLSYFRSAAEGAEARVVAASSAPQEVRAEPPASTEARVVPKAGSLTITDRTAMVDLSGHDGELTAARRGEGSGARR